MKQRIGLVLLMVLVLGGCAETPTVTSSTVPAWIRTGQDEALASKIPKDAFFGVGAVSGVQNEPLAWDAAENRSRVQLVKQVRAYTAYLMEDFASATSEQGATRDRVAEEQHISRVMKTFAAMTLRGVRPIDRWKDKDGETFYVLSTLSLKNLQDAVANSTDIDQRMKNFVQANSDKAMERLEKEEAKRLTTP